MAEQGTDMAEQRIDYVTKHALMQLFNARAEILDRFGLLTGVA